MQNGQCVIYCDCAHTDIIAPHVKEVIRDGLMRKKIAYEAVPDLCKLAATRDPRLQKWAQNHQLTVIACFERTIQWLFHFGQAPLKQHEALTIHNMRTESPEHILGKVSQNTRPSLDFEPAHLEKTDQWIPWFPVIDYDRCKRCKLCLNFCLFGVYENSEEDQVRVSEPASCKTNCPACARVCPHQAIIFPKSEESPINGAKVDPTEQASPKKQACLNELLTGNVYDILKQRGKPHKRFSAVPRSTPSILETLHQELDIPMGVLHALSPSDLSRIHRRTQQKTRHEASENE
jgi:Pyruvate/2-oxoacid:ferredoxin oxidoreductase delta subunit